MKIYLFQTKAEAELYAIRLTRKNAGWWYKEYRNTIDKEKCDKHNAVEMQSWKQIWWEGEINAIEILDHFNNQVCIYGYWE